MRDLFLAQMGDFFREGVCFDTSTEGNGGPLGAAPIVRRSEEEATVLDVKGQGSEEASKGCAV